MDVICKRCGSINDFYTKMKAMHSMAYCNGCGNYIKNVAYNEPKLYFGKYKDTLVSEIDDRQYLEWVVAKEIVKGSTLEAVKQRIIDLQK